MSQDEPATQTIDGSLQFDWNIREVFDIVLKINDALIGREGRPIPLHPEEVARLLQLKHFIDSSLKYATRRCLCNKVYCRSPQKGKPCIFDSDKILEDNSIIFSCRWRGKRL